MRTEDDLRRAYADLADRAPAESSVTIPQYGEEVARRRTGRRRLIAVGAATAVGVVVPVAVIAINRESAEPVTAPASRWSYIFRLSLPEGWSPSGRTVETRYQTAYVGGVRGQVCDIVVYRPGVFDTTRIPAARTSASVNGRPGFVAVMPDLRQPLPPPIKQVFAPGLVWRYTDDAWASVSCSNYNEGARSQDLLADEFTIAKALTAQPETVALPFRIDGLPPGWSAASLRVQQGSYGGPMVRPDFSLQIRPSSWSPPATPDPLAMEQPTGPNVSVTFGRGSTLMYPPHPTHTTINGRPAVLWHGGQSGQTAPRAAGIVITGADLEIRVSTTRWTRGFDATLRSVAESIELATNLKDRSTWFDADVAIP
jgi:hypothetical protein